MSVVRDITLVSDEVALESLYAFLLSTEFLELKMIGYATLGVKDLEEGRVFYDALLALVGGKMLMGLDRIKFYGSDAGGAMLAICTPENELDQTCGNGQMVAIPGGSPEGAAALYKKSIELGATDAGEPGQRSSFFYGAYVHDPDGNKLCFYHMTPA